MEGNDKMLIYLLRHGETDWNLEHRLQGREDIPLNENGIRMTHEAKKMLKDVHIDFILSSPLSRAVTTAKIISDYICVPVTIENDLTERDFGSLSGMSHVGKNIFKLTDEHPEVETVEHVGDRMMGVIKKYPSDSAILLISHGGAINGLLVKAFGTEPDSPGRAVLKNLCLSCLVYNGTDFRVVFFNKNV